MIYEIEEAVDDAILNLNDIAEEKDTPLFPASVKFIKETEKSENFLTANIMTVSVSASYRFRTVKNLILLYDW